MNLLSFPAYGNCWYWDKWTFWKSYVNKFSFNWQTVCANSLVAQLTHSGVFNRHLGFKSPHPPIIKLLKLANYLYDSCQVSSFLGLCLHMNQGWLSLFQYAFSVFLHLITCWKYKILAALDLIMFYLLYSSCVCVCI